MFQQQNGWKKRPSSTYHISKGNIDPQVIVSYSQPTYTDQSVAAACRKNCK